MSGAIWWAGKVQDSRRVTRRPATFRSECITSSGRGPLRSRRRLVQWSAKGGSRDQGSLSSTSQDR